MERMSRPAHRDKFLTFVFIALTVWLLYWVLAKH
jgi:hypothetical protein